MAQQGLTRYDTSTFRPIRRLENPTQSIIPRFSLPGESYPQQELAIIPRNPLYGEARIGTPPQKPPEPVQMNSESSEDWEETLFNNQSIGVHRFSYLFNKIPGIVLIMIGAWVIFGRGDPGDAWCDEHGQNHTNGCLLASEKAMGISSFAAGIITVVSVAVVSQNHNYDLNNAHFQSTLRMIASAFHILISLVVTVFSAISLAELNGKDEPNLPVCYPIQCLSLNERIGHSGTLLGISLLILVLSIVSIFFGVVGVAQINKDKRVRKEARQRRQYVEYATLPGSNYHF